jgi:D-alanyl-D-alanine carboxypeptidase-like protein/putative Flp pilus-assembly TadE/G-like protein
MWVAAVALVGTMLLALGPMGRAVGQRTQARNAADAAALAGAAEGEPSAREVARENHAELVRFEEVGDSVVVEVEIDGITAFARARARQVPTPAAGGVGGVPSSGTGERAGLAPAMLAALAAADVRLGRPVPIASGFRSRAQQEGLWERRASNPYPVAPPGSSKHERGLAVDVPRHFVDDLLAVAGEAGLCQPLPESDPVHFEVCGT